MLLLFACFGIPAAAQGTYDTPAPSPVVDDVFVTQEDLDQWETASGLHNSDGLKARATGLIIEQALYLSKSGGNLIVSGRTVGNDDVDKTGFTYVKVQRFVNGVWQDYAVWTDIYSSTNRCMLGKSVEATAGYSYRVICNHYAQKSKFWLFKSEQNAYNETGSLSF